MIFHLILIVLALMMAWYFIKLLVLITLWLALLPVRLLLWAIAYRRSLTALPFPVRR
jgi:hypothetical protein